MWNVKRALGSRDYAAVKNKHTTSGERNRTRRGAFLKKALKKREYLSRCQKEEWEGSETANVKMNGCTGLLAN